MAAFPLTAAIQVLEALMREPYPTDPVSIASLYGYVGYVLAVTVLIGALPIFWELSRHGLLTIPGSEPPRTRRRHPITRDTYGRRTHPHRAKAA